MNNTTLWALAMDDDEPERQDAKFSVDSFPEEVPDWYRHMVRSYLAPQPRDRPSATELTHVFLPLPSQATKTTIPTLEPRTSFSNHPTLDFLTPELKKYPGTAAALRDALAKNTEHQR